MEVPTQPVVTSSEGGAPSVSAEVGAVATVSTAPPAQITPSRASRLTSIAIASALFMRVPHQSAAPACRASLVGGTLIRLGVGAGPLLLPLLLQVALGWSPLKAGLVSLWQSVGALSAKPATAYILRRWGYRKVLVVTVITSAFLVALPGFFRAGIPPVVLGAVFVLSGFSRSNQFTAANTVAYADVPSTRTSAASTLATVTQQVGLSFGISFAGIVLHLAMGDGGALTADRFILPYCAVGAVMLLAVPSFWRLHPSAGSSLASR